MKKINFTIKSFLIISLFILGCNKDTDDPIYLNPEAGISFLDIENDGYQVTLAAQAAPKGQTGTWRIHHGEHGRFDNINDAKSQFYGEPGETYQLGWELSQGKEYEADVITVSFKAMQPVLKMVATDTIHNNVSLYLKAEEAKFGAQGTWSINTGEGARIENAENHNAEFVGEAYNDYTVKWTLAYGSKQEYVEYSFKTDDLSAYAGDDNLDIKTERDAEKFYSLQAFLPAGAIGEWNIITGEEGNIYNVENANSLFEGNPDIDYKLTWKVNIDNKESIDTLNLRFRGRWGVWKDPRDNQTYKFTELNGLEWMSENYNYVVNPGTGSWYYGYAERSTMLDGHALDTKEERKKYGRLYRWETAMLGAPDGWRLPSEAEYFELEKYLGGPLAAGPKVKEGGESGLDLGYNGYFQEFSLSDPAIRNVFKDMDQYGIFWTNDFANNTGLGSAKVVTPNGDLMTTAHPNIYYYGLSVRYVREVQN
jgi:uncharacterized protein (TIGR02145 family)